MNALPKPSQWRSRIESSECKHSGAFIRLDQRVVCMSCAKFSLSIEKEIKMGITHEPPRLPEQRFKVEQDREGIGDRSG